MRYSKRLAALATVGAATAALVGASPASADLTQYDATGNSTVIFGGSVLKALESNGCGPLAATPTGTATVVPTAGGKVKAVFPITKFVQSDTGAIRIEHGGSGVEFTNSCYDVRMTNLYIQDLDGSHQTVYYDVLAKTISADEDGSRVLDFRLDTTPATAFFVARPNSFRVVIKGLTMILSENGAAEFNQLATGDETTGPFASGDKVGKGRTNLRLPN